MKNSRYEVYVLCIFGIIVYVTAVLFLFNGLNDLNKFVKQEIYKHYNVPLDSK